MPTTRLQGRKVLIVDDDRDICSAMELAMRAEGAQTCTAADGNEALTLWQTQTPDAIVLDMMLPRRSGFLVLEKIKHEPDSPVVVMVTANQGKRHMTYAQTVGVDAYLYKPVPLQRLIDVLVNLLDKRA
jgi:DNA-binding response OmpR family regulator